MRFIFTVLLFFFSFSSILIPQHNYSLENNKHNSSNSITISSRPGYFYSLIRTKDSQAKLDSIDLRENLDLIVEFKEEPLFLSKNKPQGSLSKSVYSSQFSSFRKDLVKLFSSYTKQFGTASFLPEIKNEFYKVFNGVSISLPRAVASSLYSLPYVKKVYLDKEVSALLKESVGIIKADSLWTEFGSEGDSIVIGILDTGIDYLHPALGGGFGMGYKVIGGFDCYHGTSDPMDDNGHGSHVAGIAASDGNPKGVAPNALLMAIKVLNQNGNGMESIVIRGIERAMDPNQDGYPDDMADVINMSFGGTGYPEDALSTAVDNAVKLGLICCAAAGNNGRFTSISSPGTAELAITAGASDKFDDLTLFSSKGPDKSNSIVKPDVLAPGSNILSVQRGGGYTFNSGTSMASPHVAGACALLKRIHPDWTPMDIKSALMTTAKDIGEEVMSQGAGRIDVLKAAKVSTLFNPSHLSFGLDNLKKKIWDKSQTVVVRNISPLTQSYSVSYSGIQPGIELRTFPEAFRLNPGESISLTFDLEADNSIIPKLESGSLTFSGNVFIKSSSGTFHLPWAFEKASRLVMNFDVMGTRFVLSDDKHSFGSEDAVWKGSSAELIVPPGNYDLLALYSTESDTLRIITRENLALKGSDTINVKPDDALNNLEFSIKDKNGNGFNGENSTWIYQITFPDSSFVRNVLVFSSLKKLFKSSNISSRFKISIGGVVASKDNRICVADFNIKGIKESKSLTNDYSDLIEENISLDIPVNIAGPEVFIIGGVKLIDEQTVSFGGNYLVSSKPEGRKWNGKVYLPGHGTKYINFEPATAISVAENISAESSSPEKDFSNLSIAVDMPPFSVYHDSVGLFTALQPAKDILLTKAGGTISLKNWLLFPDGYHKNNYKLEPSIFADPYLFGQMNEHYLNLTEKIVYKIFDGDNLIAMDTLKNFKPIDAAKKKYRSEFSNIRYYIEGFESNGLMNCSYDLSLTDPNPPEIHSLQIRNSKGIPESRLEKGEKARIFLSAYDYLLDSDYDPYRMPVEDDSTQIFARIHGDKKWKKLNTVKISEDSLAGSYYSADISSMTNYDSTALDVKVLIYDVSLNSTEYSLEPAVAIGKFRANITVQDVAQEMPLPGEYALYNNYPNPFNPSTTLSFSLPEESFLKIEIFDLIGQKVTTLMEERKKEGDYNITWKADNYPSGIYFCRFTARGKRHFEKTIKLMLLK